MVPVGKGSAVAGCFARADKLTDKIAAGSAITTIDRPDAIDFVIDHLIAGVCTCVLVIKIVFC